MSLNEEWDTELHRAEAILEEDTRRFGGLHAVAPSDGDDDATAGDETPPPER
jgi:hypothetical protein